jgi:hypothetical protein
MRTLSRHDSLDEDPSFRGPDLEVEVAQEVHTEDTVDAVAEVRDVCVHVRQVKPSAESWTRWHVRDVTTPARRRAGDDARLALGQLARWMPRFTDVCASRRAVASGARSQGCERGRL